MLALFGLLVAAATSSTLTQAQFPGYLELPNAFPMVSDDHVLVGSAEYSLLDGLTITYTAETDDWDLLVFGPTSAGAKYKVTIDHNRLNNRPYGDCTGLLSGIMTEAGRIYENVNVQHSKLACAYDEYEQVKVEEEEKEDDETAAAANTGVEMSGVAIGLPVDNLPKMIKRLVVTIEYDHQAIRDYPFLLTPWLFGYLPASSRADDITSFRYVIDRRVYNKIMIPGLFWVDKDPITGLYPQPYGNGPELILQHIKTDTLYDTFLCAAKSVAGDKGDQQQEDELYDTRIFPHRSPGGIKLKSQGTTKGVPLLPAWASGPDGYLVGGDYYRRGWSEGVVGGCEKTKECIAPFNKNIVGSDQSPLNVKQPMVDTLRDIDAHRIDNEVSLLINLDYAKANLIRLSPAEEADLVPVDESKSWFIPDSYDTGYSVFINEYVYYQPHDPYKSTAFELLSRLDAETGEYVDGGVYNMGPENVGVWMREMFSLIHYHDHLMVFEFDPETRRVRVDDSNRLELKPDDVLMFVANPACENGKMTQLSSGASNIDCSYDNGMRVVILTVDEGGNNIDKLLGETTPCASKRGFLFRANKKTEYSLSSHYILPQHVSGTEPDKPLPEQNGYELFTLPAVCNGEITPTTYTMKEVEEIAMREGFASACREHDGVVCDFITEYGNEYSYSSNECHQLIDPCCTPLLSNNGDEVRRKNVTPLFTFKVPKLPIVNSDEQRDETVRCGLLSYRSNGIETSEYRINECDTNKPVYHKREISCPVCKTHGSSTIHKPLLTGTDLHGADVGFEEDSKSYNHSFDVVHTYKSYSCRSVANTAGGESRLKTSTSLLSLIMAADQYECDTTDYELDIVVFDEEVQDDSVGEHPKDLRPVQSKRKMVGCTARSRSPICGDPHQLVLVQKRHEWQSVVSQEDTSSLAAPLVVQDPSSTSKVQCLVYSKRGTIQSQLEIDASADQLTMVGCTSSSDEVIPKIDHKLNTLSCVSMKDSEWAPSNCPDPTKDYKLNFAMYVYNPELKRAMLRNDSYMSVSDPPSIDRGMDYAKLVRDYKTVGFKVTCTKGEDYESAPFYMKTEFVTALNSWQTINDFLNSEQPPRIEEAVEIDPGHEQKEDNTTTTGPSLVVKVAKNTTEVEEMIIGQHDKLVISLDSNGHTPAKDGDKKHALGKILGGTLGSLAALGGIVAIVFYMW